MDHVRMNRILSVISLLILSPTILAAPFTAALAVTLPARLFYSFTEPSEFLQEFYGEQSLASARLRELLWLFWIWGYFVIILGYIALWLPEVQRWSAGIWRATTVYLSIILLTRPWEHSILAGKPLLPAASKWAFGITALLLLVSLAGVLADQLSRRVRARNGAAL